MSPQALSIGESHSFDPLRLCRHFSERAPQALVALEGPAHIIRYLNAAFARLSGKMPNELLGHSFAEVVPETRSNGCLALLDRVYQTGAPTNLAEQEHCQAPPAYWSYEMWAIIGAHEDPVGVMVQVTDATETAIFRRHSIAMNEALVVSSVRQHELIDTIERNERERRELETQMFQAQKLESLGVLAGGIAHDLNNMLTPVLGYTELASQILPEGSPAASMLDEVMKNAQRAAELVKQILEYAGKGRFVVQLIDLSTLVREMGGLLGSAVSPHAQLKYDLLPALPLIEADSTQIYQVILNLVTNASEAIGETGGIITVRTGLIAAERTGPGSPSSKSDLLEAPAVFLEVTDSGCGMTPDVIEKIFDPFFTTKFTGRGLGLAVVHGIVRGHGGVVKVASEPGRGSSFRLILPCSKKTVTPPPSPPSAEGWMGTGTVLVIDDDEMVRRLVTFMLEQAGLTVLVAPDGQSGLKEFREHPQGINAVVLDLTMPNMSGLEVAEVLQSIQPNIPIVLMSGFSVQEVKRLSQAIQLTGFVQKPFKSADLLAVVRHGLGQ